MGFENITVLRCVLVQVLNIPIDSNQMETTLHGSFAFPIAVYQQVLNRNVLGYINWHWHEEIQFCCVTKGAVSFHVNEREYLLCEGEGVFVNSGYLHMSRPVGGPDSTYLCLDVNPRLLSSYPGSVFDREYIAPYRKDPSMAHLLLKPEVEWQRSVLDGVQRIYRLFEDGGFGYEWEIAAELGRMWCTMLEHREDARTGPGGYRVQSNAAVQTILTYLHDHCGEHVVLEDVARAASFSPGECCRLFKQVTGETIFSYLQSYRLARSVQLLRTSDATVSRIAYECGFCSASYFIEVFKRTFGMTPRQLRKTFN